LLPLTYIDRTYIGLAMRTCIDLGLHRRTPSRCNSVLDVEMQKRIFWTCYSLDRQISIILGRPFAISDRDVDAEVGYSCEFLTAMTNWVEKLPLDVNESVQDSRIFEAALQDSQLVSDQAPAVSTSLSCFLHICRLRRIESQIQQSIYRVDEPSRAVEAEVESFIQQLEDWKEKIPRDARQHVADKPSTRTDTVVIDGYGYYVISLLSLLSGTDANGADLDGLLLQMHEVLASSTSLSTGHEHSFLENMRRSLRGCLPNVQETSPEYSGWIFPNGFAFGFPRR
jgi:hypothetical protein